MMKPESLLLLAALAWTCVACAEVPAVGPDANADSAADPDSAIAAPDAGFWYTDGGPPPPPFCTADDQCQNGVFCDGFELCDPTAPGADEFGCVPSPTIACASAALCDETMDRCATDCEIAPDADHDGHWSVTCGGDDCDDTRAEVFPGAVEVCNGHDDDCDLTVDDLDADGDGHRPIACGGDDCDDTSAAVMPGATESCNAIDDDCDGVIDDGIPGVGDACGPSFFSCTPRRACAGGEVVCVGTVVTATGTASASGIPSAPTTLSTAVAHAAAMGGGDVCVVGAYDAPVPIAANVAVPPGVRVVGTDTAGTARAYAYLNPATDVGISVSGTPTRRSGLYDLYIRGTTTAITERIAADGYVTLDTIRVMSEWEFQPGTAISVRGPATLNNVYGAGSSYGVRVRGAPGVARLANVSGRAWIALELTDVEIQGPIGVPNPGTLTYGLVRITNATGTGRLQAYEGWGGGGPLLSVVQLTGDLDGLDLEASGVLEAETGTLIYVRDCVGSPRLTVTGSRAQRSPYLSTSATFVRVSGAFCSPVLDVDVDTRTETNCGPDACTAVDCSESPCTIESLRVRSAGGMTALRCSSGGCADVARIDVEDLVGSTRPASPLVELDASSPRIARGLVIRRTTVTDDRPLAVVTNGQPSMTNVQLWRVGAATAPVLLHDVTRADATLDMRFCGLMQTTTSAAIPALLESTAPPAIQALNMASTILAFGPGTPMGSLPMARFEAGGPRSMSGVVFGNASGTPLVGAGGAFLLTPAQVDSAPWADGARDGTCTVSGTTFDCAVAVDAASPTGAPPQDRLGRARPQGAGYDIGPVELR